MMEREEITGWLYKGAQRQSMSEEEEDGDDGEGGDYLSETEVYELF